MHPVVPWLHTASAEGLPAKAGRLVVLAQAGLPVPRGLVLPPDAAALDEATIDEALRLLLREGPVIVRSALAGEDADDGSAAGLGRSYADCRDPAAIRHALEQLAAQRDDPWLRAYRRRHPDGDIDRAIVQQQIPRRALLVIAVPSDGVPEIEVHTGPGEALAEGQSPVYAGPLARWDDASAAAVSDAVQRTIAALGPARHGHDLELVVDPDDRVHVVQARPLAAPLHPGWPAFLHAVQQAGEADRLHGILTLDAEHNPAPLSPAHAWLMDWLRRQRPAAGDPTVLAGWLYVRTLPRDLARAAPRQGAPSSPPPSSPPPSALDTLRQLQHHTLPTARARLEALREHLRDADGPTLADAHREAEQAFLAMIDTYVGVLIPARTRARRAAGGSLHSDAERPLSTRGRDAFLDVLPATWDLASPSLAELGTAPAGDHAELPDDEGSAATLLGEWDDHLFALGLAPLRAWYRAAGEHLGLHDDVFMLHPPELDAALRSAAPVPRATIDQRRAQWQRQAELHPPLRIEDGRPVSFARRAHLRGVPIGPSFEGVLAPRSGLPALLADPPGPDAIVTLPALTAPAAVALQQLGVRAVCCEHGGALSHAALMARELGLSALVGCRGCTALPSGRHARLDTTVGRLVLQPERDATT